jgi:peptidoglycan/LPS O-acetylase OafA/YrhL
VLFPLIVSLGAGGSLKGKYSTRICGFLGDISYPMSLLSKTGFFGWGRPQFCW